MTPFINPHNRMNYFQPNHSYLSRLPGYNPVINFSNKGNHQDDKLKNKAVRKDMPLKQDELYIILADDDSDDRELFGEVIKDTGLKVKLDFAEDGRELLAMLESSAKELPQLIFLDLNMPNKSGTECLEIIRSSEKLKHLPVVIYSTSASIKDIDETFERGANLYIRKPSSYHDLLSMAKRVLMLDWEKYKARASKANFIFSDKTK